MDHIAYRYVVSTKYLYVTVDNHCHVFFFPSFFFSMRHNKGGVRRA